ncbi:MAG: PAS domain S-box protein [Methanoregula sp.]|nr:PAS domain S-box protein [Methanoregula sp.]
MYTETEMAEYQTEIIRIKELLATHPDGMSITEISAVLDMNRNTVAKYMDILQIQGAVDGRKRGTSKVYYQSERLPVTSLRKICTRPFFVIDHEGEIIDQNQEFCTLVAMTGDQISGHSLENLPIRYLDGIQPGQLVKAVLKGNEQRIRAQVRKDEKTQPVTLLMVPVVFENGKPGVSVMVDLDNPSAEMSRKDTTSPDVLALLDDEMEYVVRRTAEGITRYVNETYCRAVGKSREELIGRPFKPLISPEDADRIQIHLAGLSIKYPVGTIEYRVVMANGELRYQRWQDRALFNSRGELDTINSFGIDITDQVLTSQKLKKTQETLEETIVHRTEELRGINRQLYSEIAQRERMEEQLLLAQFAMDRATDMVFWIDQDARIRYANDVAAEGLLYSRNELLDCQFGDVVPFYSLGEWDLLWQDLKTGRPVSRETHVVKKDGTGIPADVRLTYLEFRGKEFVYCSSRDLSERIRMDRALKEANKKINVYTSIARHDIQNKITIVLAYLGRIKKAITDPVLLEYLNRQEHAVKAIRTEINMTRDFKDMGLRSPEWQNITAIIAGVIRQYEQKPVRIISDLPDVEIFADAQLDRVFDRLMEKITGTGDAAREIQVSHQIRDGALIISFNDNGPGFSAEEKDQLFDIQHDGSGNRGLFIAREILSLTDIVLSETGEPGQGARFEIRIPETYYRFLQETAN